MNEQAHMVNQSQLMSQSHIMNQSQMTNQNQPPPPLMNQSQPPQLMNQNQPPPQLMNQNQPPPQLMNQNQPPPQLMNQNQPLPQLMNPNRAVMMKQPQMMMNQPPPMGMNRSYGPWTHQQAANANVAMDPIKYQPPFNPTFNASHSSSSGRSNNWKGKRGIINRKDGRAGSGMMNVAAGGYKPPTLHELQSQNRKSARKFYPKKKFNTNRFAPYAPRNTTSFLIRAKKSGGIASLVSPCPVTPAVLPTPMFSPSREVLGDMAKEEWGVDGYGSMKGLIRLRSPGNEAEMHDEDEGSSESDVEEHVEVERRLDHDLSRFEMIYPNCEVEYNNLLENRVDDQDTHIAQLEEENLTLKERIFLMERELGELRRRLHCLERQTHMDDLNEEVVENGSDNESDNSRNHDFRAMGAHEAVDNVADNEGSCADAGFGENTEDGVDYLSGNEEKEVNGKEENHNEAVDVSMDELAIVPKKGETADEDKSKDSELEESNTLLP